MQTHDDNQHQLESAKRFMDRLKQRAEQNKGKSQITAGRESEEALCVWTHGEVQVRHMPDDEQGILRISIGGGQTPVPLNYCVIRGGVGQCIELLEKAIAALKASP